MKYLLFVGVLFFIQPAIAQKTTEPIEKIQHFIQTGDTAGLDMSLVYLNQNMDRYMNPELIHLLLRATDVAENKNLKQISGFYSVTKIYYDATNNKAKSFEYALKIYKLLSKTHQTGDLLWVMIDIGNIFYEEDDYDQARSFYRKAEQIASKGTDKYPFSVIYMNYGLIEADRGNHRGALEYYKKSCWYRKQSENIKIISNTFIKIANTYLSLHKPDSTMYYIRLAEDYYYNKGEETAILIDMPDYIYFTYAEYYAYFKNYTKAHEYIRKAQEYSKKNGIFEEYIIDVNTQAGYFAAEKRYEEAIHCLLQMLPELRKFDMIEQKRNLYKKLSKYYAELKLYDKVDFAVKKYIQLDDSIDRTTLRSKLNLISSIAAAYENDAQLLQTEKNLHILEINNKIKTRQGNASILIAVISFILIIILLILFLNMRNNRKKMEGIHRKIVSQNKEIKINSIELERTNQLKDKLFSIIAHDLRNPLNRLLVELAIVKKSVAEKDVTLQMENTLKETIDLFEGLLQWSKLDNKQNIYSPTKTNLNDNITKVIAFYSAEIEKNQVEIVHIGRSLTAFADQNILQTLLRNLISNSISSVSRVQGKRRITIEFFEMENNKIHLVFSDTGPGFPQEIIDDFYSEETSLNTSSGLGLSICKLLAKMSGWEMHISNFSGRAGARITVDIPSYVEVDLPEQSKEFMKNEMPPLSLEWKQKLGNLSTFKYYQTSQIRNEIKGLGEISDASVQLWIEQLEKAVHEGDESAYKRIMKLLN